MADGLFDRLLNLTGYWDSDKGEFDCFNLCFYTSKEYIL